MHATSVHIAHEQFIHHQPVVYMLVCSEDFCTRVVRALLHTRVFLKIKSSCTICFTCACVCVSKDMNITVIRMYPVKLVN